MVRNRTSRHRDAGIVSGSGRAREVYVTDEMFAAVYERADGALQDAMDLALLIGQRVADLIGARRSDVKDGFLQVRQRKTGKPLRFEVTPELQRIIARATGRTREAAGVYILADSKGRPLTYWALRRRFDAAREAAGKENAELAAWQFRDLRARRPAIRNPSMRRKAGSGILRARRRGASIGAARRSGREAEGALDDPNTLPRLLDKFVIEHAAPSGTRRKSRSRNASATSRTPNSMRLVQQARRLFRRSSILPT
jgi:integrase-like protein